MKDLTQAMDKPMLEIKSREERIREAAYHRSVTRGDGPGNEETDWLEAEAEVDAVQRD